MDLMLRRHIRQLMFEAEKIQKGLEVVERHHAALAEQGQQSDMTHVIRQVQRLECDVSVMLANCVADLHLLILEWNRLGKWTDQTEPKGDSHRKLRDLISSTGPWK